jgi:hypothetical protein
MVKVNTRRGMETAEMRFLRAVVGYRMTDHKRDENREVFGVTDVTTMIKTIKISDYNIRKNSCKPNPETALSL